MTYETEDEVKNALGITSWRNLSKDTVIRFAAMRSDIDADVAKAIIAQIPAYAGSVR